MSLVSGVLGDLAAVERRVAALSGSAERPGTGGREVGASGAPPPFEALVARAAARHAVDPALVRAVVATESGGNPNAVSSAGARGLMQLMPATAAAYGASNALDPDQNLNAGTAYLHDLLARFGDLRSAVAAYNAGPQAVARYGGVPPFAETREYVDRVLSAYHRLALP